MKVLFENSKKLVLGIILSLLSSTAFASGPHCIAFYVQLIVTSSPGKAHGMKKSFDKVGFNTEIFPYKSNGNVLYRVRTGPYQNKATAQNTQRRMKSVLSGNPTVQKSIITEGAVHCGDSQPAQKQNEIDVAKDVSADIKANANGSTPKRNRTGLRFSQFKAPASYSGANQPLVLDEFSRTFRTRLREAIKNQKPSFAGHYIVTGWGCGSSGCNTGAVINAKTGVATPWPVALASVFPLKNEFKNEDGQEHIYRIDSRLMIFAGNIGGAAQGNGSDSIEFYEFTKGSFKFLESRPYGRAKQY